MLTFWLPLILQWLHCILSYFRLPVYIVILIGRVKCNWHVLYTVGCNPLLDQINKNKIELNYKSHNTSLAPQSYNIHYTLNNTSLTSDITSTKHYTSPVCHQSYNLHNTTPLCHKSHNLHYTLHNTSLSPVP